jgi:drug/metabolite transporter (DMT)-like permease
MLLQLTRLTYKHARRIVVLVIGVTLLLIGVAMIVLPGPGILVILFGLAVLATEFVWARQLLKRIKQTAGLGRAPGATAPSAGAAPPAPQSTTGKDSSI